MNKALNQVKNLITKRSTLRLGVDAPIEKLIQKLIDNGYARRNKESKVLAKGLTHLVHLDHFEIIKYFNSRITGIVNYYSFTGNRSSLQRVLWIIRQSCALTLARKFKLRTMRKVFNRFGFDLMDLNTETKLEIPKNLSNCCLKRLSDFKTNKGPLNETALDKILNEKWSNKVNKK